MELKDIKFTKDEFDMLIKGIEVLPNQDAASDIMSGLLDCILSDKISNEARAKMEMEKARKEKKKQIENEILKENCCILQSKLIQLRRFMEQNDLLVQAQEIINNN
jgi:hypothetical protein